MFETILKQSSETFLKRQWITSLVPAILVPLSNYLEHGHGSCSSMVGCKDGTLFGCWNKAASTAALLVLNLLPLNFTQKEKLLYHLLFILYSKCGPTPISALGDWQDWSFQIPLESNCTRVFILKALCESLEAHSLEHNVILSLLICSWFIITDIEVSFHLL